MMSDEEEKEFDGRRTSTTTHHPSVRLCNVEVRQPPSTSTSTYDAIIQNSSSSSRRSRISSATTNSDEPNDDDEDLVGILSCGPGQYCFPVLDLSWENQPDDDDDDDDDDVGGTGKKLRPTGICVDGNGHHHHQQQQQQQRLLQRNNNDEDDNDVDPMIGQNLIAKFCGTAGTTAATERQDGSSTTAGEAAPGCDCSNVDFETMTGTIDCTFEEVCNSITDVCGNPVERCYTTTYNIDIPSSTAYTYNYCYDYTSPVVMSACYTQQFVYAPPTTTSGPQQVGEDGTTTTTTTTTMNDVGSINMVTSECQVGLYGTMCNSCRVVPKSADEPNTACFVMDCTNIPLMGPTPLPRGVCEDSDVDSPLGAINEKFLIFDMLPCPGGCNLCGEDGSYMNNKESTVVFPGTDFVYDCATLQVSALSGGLADLSPEYGNMCNKLSVAAHEPCGCVDRDGNEILVPPTLMPTISARPTMPPTEIPDEFLTNSMPGGSGSGSSSGRHTSFGRGIFHTNDPRPVVTTVATVAAASLGAAAVVASLF